MSRFEPIAIIGQSCVYPGAFCPNEFWNVIINKKDVITEWKNPPWGVSEEIYREILRIPRDQHQDLTRAGFVKGFEKIFNPEGFLIPAEEILNLDPMFRWIFHAGREALRSARYDKLPASSCGRIGVILGILAYPTGLMSAFCQSALLASSMENLPPDILEQLGLSKPSARNFFNSGMAAYLLRQALGLNGNAFALDGACASSIYAIKLACNELQRGHADLMLAGAVNGADKLLARVALTAMGAVSKTGVSRPFDQKADGIVPSEGAAFIVLKRLSVAERDQDPILGVIRGIGLSNDGRGKGLTAPSSEGQVRAIRQAYSVADLTPEQITLVECHATSTTIGDKTELKSMKEIWKDLPPRSLVIGSVKSNMGHLLAPAGLASLQKVLGAFQHSLMPPTIHCEDPLDELRDRNSCFRVLTDSDLWTEGNSPRMAAVNSFGFGGCNAHLIVEEYMKDNRKSFPTPVATPRCQEIAIVGMGVSVGSIQSVDAFSEAILMGKIPSPSLHDIELKLAGLKFPPNDLRDCLPQQVLMLKVALDAVEDMKSNNLPRDRTGVFIGAQADPEITSYLLKWRLKDWLKKTDLRGSPEFEPLTSPKAVGTIPNMPANRISSQLDLGGQSFVVAAEELSGVKALEVAVEVLQNDELDAAIVGAVDISSDERFIKAFTMIHPEFACKMGDGAIALVLKRLDDAYRDGDRIYSIIESLEEEPRGPEKNQYTLPSNLVSNICGHVHAASGLLQVSAATLSAYLRVLPEFGRLNARPWLLDDVESRRVRVAIETFGGLSTSVTISAREMEGGRRTEILSRWKKPFLFPFSSTDPSSLIQQIQQYRSEIGKRLSKGLVQAAYEIPIPNKMEGCRLALLVDSEEDLVNKLNLAVDRLAQGLGFKGLEDIYYGDLCIEGDLAFVFTGGAASYAGMGQEFLIAFPQVLDSLNKQSRSLANISQQPWTYPFFSDEEIEKDYSSIPLRQMWATSFLAQAHGEFTQHVLGLRPQAIIGYSSGEANGLYSMGVWKDVDQVYQDTFQTSLFTNDLAGRFEAVRKAWRAMGFQREASEEGQIWESWTLPISPDEVRKALVNEPLVHLSMINNPNQCVISGYAKACQRVVKRLGGSSFKLPYANVNHCPEVETVREAYIQLHDREVQPVTRVRFYTNATGTHYQPTRESAAKMIYEQALHTLDFPRLIENAYNDGVHIFIEHGPRNFCTRQIEKILEGKDFLAVSIDAKGQDSLRQSLRLVAQLVVHGVDVDLKRLRSELYKGAEISEKEVVNVLHFPVHWNTPTLPKLKHQTSLQPKEEIAELVPAPAIPKILPIKQRSRRPSLEELPSSERKLNRQDLEELASDNISNIFGPSFQRQDHYRRQVRLPEPPLLLTDRVLSIEGDPSSLGKGRIVTETDVKWDSWYLHDGVMPAGIMIEAGQSDLLLASWLGIDFVNQDQRVYRLLSGEVCFFGGLPRPDDSLQFTIFSDGFDKMGEGYLYSFHSECRINGQIRLKVSNGRAGFFTEKELLSSRGIVLEVDQSETTKKINPNFPINGTQKRQFTGDDIQAFTEGRIFDCFGPGFENGQAHVRTPGIPGGPMILLGEKIVIDPEGGRRRLGYLKAESLIRPEHWYFNGHFKNDPCMPGNLMFEGCLQAMAFYMTTMGYTLERDGWRFEPTPNHPFRLQCRGQVTPTSRQLTYEIFVKEIHDSPRPTLFAEALITVDGLRSFYCPNMGLSLVPDWPLYDRKDFLQPSSFKKYLYDKRSIMASSLGRQSDVFGEAYRPFDVDRKALRLPNPPYLFMDRISRIENCPFGETKENGCIETEYDVPPNAWYFDPKENPRMPLSALLEIAMQPCGWITTFTGAVLESRDDLFFRNLDGEVTIKNLVTPDVRSLTTSVKLTGISRLKGSVLNAFDVQIRREEEIIAEMKLGFGLFTQETLDRQIGLTSNEIPEAILTEITEFPVTNLTSRPEAFFSGTLKLPDGNLLMLDRVTGFWPKGGRAGLGQIRAEKVINPGGWFFKAHFFQDPVQPGSLGLEAILQLLQFYAIQMNLARDFREPYFESLLLDQTMTYSFRGQVTPKHKLVTVMAEIVSIDEIKEGKGFEIKAEGWLCVDGRPIYQARNLGIRIVDRDRHTQAQKRGPVVFSKEQLLSHASGSIVDAFGEKFKEIDSYKRRIRIPQPPLLLCDRITRLDAHPFELIPGSSIESETELHPETWYLEGGRIPAGFLCEASQANLVLLSWMGIDRLTKGKRNFRLLDVDVTFFGDLPEIGDLLKYRIDIKKFSRLDNLCIVDYETICRVNGSVRFKGRCKAGFFTDLELAKTAGLKLDLSRIEIDKQPSLISPVLSCERRHFEKADLIALSAGRVSECFGDNYAAMDKHRSTPKIQGEDLLFFDRITAVDLKGGTWGRGYLRAEAEVQPDYWLFKAHFKDDPVFPGTLLLEAALQALSIYLLYMGFSLNRDAHHFAPIEKETIHIECRGQITTKSKKIVYEVFIKEIGDQPTPYIKGDVLITVDGLKAINIGNVCTRIVPDEKCFVDR